MKKILHKSIHQFPVIVTEESSGGYFVTCPSFEGCYSQGKTIDKALKNITEVIEICLEELPKSEKQKTFKENISLHFVTV